MESYLLFLLLHMPNRNQKMLFSSVRFNSKAIAWACSIQHATHTQGLYLESFPGKQPSLLDSSQSVLPSLLYHCLYLAVGRQAEQTATQLWWGRVWLSAAPLRAPLVSSSRGQASQLQGLVQQSDRIDIEENTEARVGKCLSMASAGESISKLFLSYSLQSREGMLNFKVSSWGVLLRIAMF